MRSALATIARAAGGAISRRKDPAFTERRRGTAWGALGQNYALAQAQEDSLAVAVARRTVSAAASAAAWSILRPAGRGGRLAARRVRSSPDMGKLVRAAVEQGEFVDLTEDHPFGLWLRKGTTSKRFRFPAAALLDLEVAAKLGDGEVVYWIERDLDVPVQLWPIPPRMLQTEGFGEDYQITIGGRPLPVRPEDVIIDRSPSIVDPYARGAGPLKALAQDIAIDKAYSEALAAALSGKGPSKLLMLPGLGPQQAEDLKAELISESMSPSTYGRVHVMAPPVDYATGKAAVGQVLDMAQPVGQVGDLAAVRRDALARAGLLIGVPDGYYNSREVNRATAAVVEARFRSGCLMPLLSARRQLFQDALFDSGEYGGDTSMILSYDLPSIWDPQLAGEILALYPETADLAQMAMAAGIDPWPGLENWRISKAGNRIVPADDLAQDGLPDLRTSMENEL